MASFFRKLILSSEQKKHLAKTVNTIGLGQLAAFGYTALQSGSGWLVLVASLCVLVVLELVALRILKNVDDKPKRSSDESD